MRLSVRAQGSLDQAGASRSRGLPAMRGPGIGMALGLRGSQGYCGLRYVSSWLTSIGIGERSTWFPRSTDEVAWDQLRGGFEHGCDGLYQDIGNRSMLDCCGTKTSNFFRFVVLSEGSEHFWASDPYLQRTPNAPPTHLQHSSFWPSCSLLVALIRCALRLLVHLDSLHL